MDQVIATIEKKKGVTLNPELFPQLKKAMGALEAALVKAKLIDAES
ncbi:MAG: hypothetical protein HYW16_00340 [Candidatus Rokubacteria bacterium]|nr:hypothetical protein [Candidatus Rokubacteria bacterium]MBI2543679.1 hypothetical protein [Candidatus Rokubacteria bacterium]